MHELSAADLLLAASGAPAWLNTTVVVLKVLIGFSVIIFVHELGHFLAAKWVGVRVDRLAVGFGTRLFGWRKGEGFTFGNRRTYRTEELAARGWGETDYCFKALPLGGYVKMLGQDDIVIDEKSGQVTYTDDPRAFTSKPVGRRMIVVSAGVVFNLLFAAALLMVVFLIGKNMVAPVIGFVAPDGPAAGKLFPGDRVLDINGEAVNSFNDVRVAPLFFEGPLEFRVEREAQGGRKEVVTTTVTPVRLTPDDLPSLGADPFVTTVRTQDGLAVGDLENVKAGDRVIEIDAQPVQTNLDIFRIFRQSEGRVLPVVVDRPDDPDRPGSPTRQVTCYQRAVLSVDPVDPSDKKTIVDSCHILGLRRRRAVNHVLPGSPAEAAGFRRGDVVAEWGPIANPTYDEIVTTIQARAGKPIRVVMLRNGKAVTLTVTPRRPFKLFGQSEARVGVDFASMGEENLPVVADVAPGTPAAELNLPRGAVLLAIDGQPVANWSDVIRGLTAAAGRTVRLRYRSAGDEAEGRMAVPGSIVNELNLPPGAVIWSVDGQRTLEVQFPEGKKRELALAQAYALGKFLAGRVGQTVTVRYSRSVTEPMQEARFTVREDNVDPWQLRLSYVTDFFGYRQLEEKVTAHGNPLLAVWLGVKYVGQWVQQVYRFLKQVVTTDVGVQHVAGPVGIFGMAMEHARLGWSDLLFFMAFLSINLAVINFLPMPIMDGGLMVFLILEKIKGKPLSFKAQMISTLVSLAAIILFGLFITVQDIGRFFGN